MGVNKIKHYEHLNGDIEWVISLRNSKPILHGISPTSVFRTPEIEAEMKRSTLQAVAKNTPDHHQNTSAPPS
jgi:hypothetical protein